MRVINHNWSATKQHLHLQSVAEISRHSVLSGGKTDSIMSRHSISQLHGHGPSIQLGADIVPACDHVRLLGVIISADLSLDRHVSVVSSASFYWLQQLRQSSLWAGHANWLFSSYTEDVSFWSVSTRHIECIRGAFCDDALHKLTFTFTFTMWDIVWVLPQGHRSVSVSRHFLLQAPQCPCSMRK